MSPIRRVDSGRMSPSQADDGAPRSPGVFDGITGGDGGVSRCLHIGNVPSTMTEVELLNVLRTHGRVETIKYVLVCECAAVTLLLAVVWLPAL